MNRVVVLVVVLLISVTALSVALMVTQPTQVCGIEQCHGLDITCGPNVPEVCTEIYMMGDACRKYANCGMANGICQLVNPARFYECKSCFEGCAEGIRGQEDEHLLISRCESDCVGD